MGEAKTKVFIVGDRAYGLVIVSFDPFHVIRVSRKEIQRYADTYFPGLPSGYDRTFRMLGRSVLTMVTDLSDRRPSGNIDDYREVYQDLFSNRHFNITNADFCVVGMIDPEQHDKHIAEHHQPADGLEGRRKSHSLLHQALDVLLNKNDEQPVDIELEKDDEMREVGDDDHGHDH